MNLLNSGKLKYHDVALNRIISHTVPAEHQNFQKDTVALIIREVMDLWWRKHSAFDFPKIEVFRKILWRWLHIDGNFTTRLAKLIKAEWNFNIPVSTLEEIGNLAKNDGAHSGEAFFDITENLDWKAGDFGDGGSCFWAGRKGIRKAMESEGNFYAIRIFEKKPTTTFLTVAEDYWGDYTRRVRVSKNYYDGYVGIGRSWLYETNIKIKLLGKQQTFPVLILFNSYGSSISTQSLILSSYLNRERGHCTLKNKGKTHGGLYFNGPGYIIGVPIVTRSVNLYDFGLQNEYDAQQATATNNPQHIQVDIDKPIYYKPKNLKARKQMNANRLRSKQAKVEGKDSSMGKYHQRYVHLLARHHNINCLRNIEDALYFADRRISGGGAANPKLVELKTKLDSLKPIYKKLDYDPIKIINHHIKNHLL